MSLVDEMIIESDCIEAIYQAYVNEKNACEIFIFFEGNDDFKYYSKTLLPAIDDRNYRKYICKGKSNVHLIYGMIHSQSKVNQNSRLLFFTDKDFDDEVYIKGNDIYITPTYAIENFYFSDKAIKNTISGILAISDHEEDDKDDYKKAVKYIIDERDNIVESILFANAWYSLQRKKSAEITSGHKPKLNMIQDCNKIQNVNTIQALEQLVNNAITVTESEVAIEKNKLAQAPDKLLRGKYFEQTMVKPYKNLINYSNDTKYGFFSKKRKIKYELCADNILDIFAQYADVPRDLIEYISSKLDTAY